MLHGCMLMWESPTLCAGFEPVVGVLQVNILRQPNFSVLRYSFGTFFAELTKNKDKSSPVLPHMVSNLGHEALRRSQTSSERLNTNSYRLPKAWITDVIEVVW